MVDPEQVRSVSLASPYSLTLSSGINRRSCVTWLGSSSARLLTPRSRIVRVTSLERKGDYITLDVPRRRLTLEVDDEELARRRPSVAMSDAFARPRGGWEHLYVEHVLQADSGADLDFLRGSSGDRVSRESH